MSSGWDFRKRLTMGITALTGGSFLAFILVFSGFSYFALRRWVALNLATQAAGIAEALQAPLDFNNPQEAESALRAVAQNPHIVRAEVFDTAQMGVATFLKENGGDRSPILWWPGDGIRYGTGRVEVSRTIRHGERVLGTVVLRSTEQGLYDVLWVILGICLGAAVPVFVLGLAVSRWLLGYLARPILDLAAMAQAVSRDKDYSVRMERPFSGELGTLAAALNRMLAEIQERDLMLLTAKESLEGKVAERTEDLLALNAQLMLAKDSALEANRAKSAFIANMSHELRTPLNAILLYGELLRDDAREEGNEGTAQDLERIMTAGTHLLGLIDNILDISKIEAGRMTVHLEEIGIRDLLDRTGHLVTPLIGKNRNRYVVETGAIPAAFLTDGKKVEQILCNLIGNAAKFTEDGEVRLRVDLADEPGFLDFEVRDTGIGMSPDQLDTVFQEFMQADSMTTRKYAGTGLGLTICRKFARLLGGEVRVVSEPGAGSTFTVKLPLHSLPVPDGQGAMSEA